MWASSNDFDGNDGTALLLALSDGEAPVLLGAIADDDVLDFLASRGISAFCTGAFRLSERLLLSGLSQRDW